MIKALVRLTLLFQLFMIKCNYFRNNLYYRNKNLGIGIKNELKKNIFFCFGSNLLYCAPVDGDTTVSYYKKGGAD